MTKQALPTPDPLAIPENAHMNSLSVLTGAQLIKNVLTDPKYMVYVVAVKRNLVQHYIASFLYFQQHDDYAKTKEEKDAAWVLLEQLQDHWRRSLERALNEAFEVETKQADRCEALAQKQRTNALRAQHALNQQPHAQGTVAELAQKLGVSKSEVRRLKASGELDAALAKLS